MGGVRAIGMGLVVGIAVAGCAGLTPEQRTTDGPTAEEMWKVGFQAINGRSPTFGEKQTFQEEMDARVRDFLRDNPVIASSYGVGNLRLFRQATVGMKKGELKLLLGAPREATEDAARMAGLAGKFWPAVKPQAKEAWVYPAGWTLYFDGDTLTDITQTRSALLPR